MAGQKLWCFFSGRRIAQGVAICLGLQLLFSTGTVCADSLSPAPLVMAPVINRVAGSGTGANLWGLSGFTAFPGVVFNYGAGYPADPAHQTYNIWNDTPYTIRSMHLSIYGSADATEEPWVIVPDPAYPATFGTVPGTGPGTGAAESDIFSTITISPDGKTIDFTDGFLLPGDRFTDIVKSYSATNPSYAAIHSSFGVPEIDPSAFGSAFALLMGSLGLFERRGRRGLGLATIN